MPEREPIPPHICPECYREKPNHAPDCRRGKQSKIAAKNSPVVEQSAEEVEAELSEKLLNTLGRDETGQMNANYVRILSKRAAPEARAKVKGMPKKNNAELDKEAGFPEGFQDTLDRVSELDKGADALDLLLNHVYPDEYQRKEYAERIAAIRRQIGEVQDTIERILDNLINGEEDADAEFPDIKPKLDAVGKDIIDLTEELADIADAMEE